MGSFVAEAGTDVSLGREKVKSSEEIKVGTEGEQGVKTPPMPDGKNPNVDENQDPLKDWGYKQGLEPDYVHKCNGNPDSPIYENGDGDLPSFSIKRLRRLPLRVSSEQQPSAVASRPEPAVDRNGRREEERQALPVDAAHSSGDSIGVPEQAFDSNISKDEVEVTPINVLEEGANEVGVQNGEIEGREIELENGKFAIEEPEVRNPGADGAEKLPGPDQSVGRVNDKPREGHAGNVLGQEISEENKDESNSANELEGEGGNKLPQSHESYVSSSNPEVEHTAPVFHVDDLGVSPETSDLSLGGVSDKESVKVESPAPVVEDPNRGIFLFACIHS